MCVMETNNYFINLKKKKIEFKLVATLNVVKVEDFKIESKIGWDKGREFTTPNE